MKLGKKESSEPKKRKKREIGGEGSKSFTALVMFLGSQSGERFKHPVDVTVKATTLISATGRAAREAFIVAKKERPGKTKWLEVNVTINPD